MGKIPMAGIDIRDQYETDIEKLRTLIEECNLDDIVKNYPVRESGILDAIAKGLRFANRHDYEKAVLKCIRSNIKLRDMMKNKLGKLASQLDKTE